MSLSLSLSLYLSFVLHISVNKVQRDGADIYTIRQAIIDERYISASWIGFNESYAVKFAHTSYTPPVIIPLSSTRPKLLARMRVRALSVFIRCRTSACVRWCVRTPAVTTRMHASMHASKRFHPPSLFRGRPSPALRMMINGLIKRFEFHVWRPRLRKETWNFVLSTEEARRQSPSRHFSAPNE